MKYCNNIVFRKLSVVFWEIDAMEKLLKRLFMDHTIQL